MYKQKNKNAMCKYDERMCQKQFFEKVGIVNDVTLSNYNDGVYKANIFEFKLQLNDLYKTLAQALNYLSILRAAGKPVPSIIHLIDIDGEKDYVFNTSEFEEYINCVPQKVSSIVDSIRPKGSQLQFTVLNYGVNADDMATLKGYLACEKYFKVSIDASCVAPWAKQFYDLAPSAKKSDFLKKELPNPKVLKDFIVPYNGDYRKDFKEVLDMLNPKDLQRQIGAYYTPEEYAEKTAKSVKKAISVLMNSGKYDNYVIIDRCAGTGNLETVLGDEILKHTIVSTFELMEWQTLNDRVGSKVLAILPAREDVYGITIEAANAMEKNFIDNPIIKEFTQDPKCAVIFLENPPFADNTSNSKHSRGTKKDKTFVNREMGKIGLGKVSNDICNGFVWSAIHYYSPDAYILYAPLKYWSVCKLTENYLYDTENAFIFNRKYFHASGEGISCITWYKPQDGIDFASNKIVDASEMELSPIAVKKDEQGTPVIFKKVIDRVNDGFIKGTPVNKKESIYCSSLDGTLRKKGDKGVRVNPYTADNQLGYMVTAAATFDGMNVSLLSLYQFNGNGKPIYTNNCMDNLPYFAAAAYERMSSLPWYKKGMHSRNGGFKKENGERAFRDDKDFLMDVFTWAMTSYIVRGKSIEENGNIIIQNNLCFDDGTWATEAYYKNLPTYQNSEGKELFDRFRRILLYCRSKKGYNQNKKYNLYQIDEEFNLYEDIINAWGGKVRHYFDPNLNSEIKNLKKDNEKFYEKYISPKLFEYGLIV